MSDQPTSQGLERCFACGRAIPRFPPSRVDTRDGQTVFVGADCYRKIKQAGEEGWQPPRGGPRLWLLPPLTGRAYVAPEVGFCNTDDPFDAQPYR